MTERILSCSEALAEALAEEMERDGHDFIVGEDLRAHEGIFCAIQRSSSAISREGHRHPHIRNLHFGSRPRAALTGMRAPSGHALWRIFSPRHDEIANQTAKIRYMFGGQAKIPWSSGLLTGRAFRSRSPFPVSGELVRSHSRAQVVVPSEPADVKG